MLECHCSQFAVNVHMPFTSAVGVIVFVQTYDNMPFGCNLNIMGLNVKRNIYCLINESYCLTIESCNGPPMYH